MASAAVRTDGHVRASGLAKKMAKEAGIDIRAVSPSGGDGTRIIARDITAYLEAQKNAPAPARLPPFPPDLRTRSPRSPGWA